MTYARQTQVSLKDTPYYHCVARCVRRAWLWGYDQYADKDYSHRKQWVIDRIRFLSHVFAIDICAYAVMSNHYHVVLHVDVNTAAAWTDDQVMERWEQLYRLPYLVARYKNKECTALAEAEVAQAMVRVFRSRLRDVSWFMRCLNEYLARRANAEDDVKGRFWEGRFKSQALLDEAGLLTAMAYVDLNPIRAGIAVTPEQSEFTSIYDRIQHLQAKQTDGPRLLPFKGEGSTRSSLPCSAADYLSLVDWTGRALRGGKRGSIDPALPAILTRLRIDPDSWRIALSPHGNVFGRAIGRLDHLRLHASALSQSWIRGIGAASRLYGKVEP